MLQSILNDLGIDNSAIYIFVVAVISFVLYRLIAFEPLKRVLFLREERTTLRIESSKEIEKEVVDPEDVEMLQDLILAAVNDALAKSQEMVSSEMNKLTGGMNIPGMM